VAATTILLARHGETDWNRDRRVQGHSDTPLNDAGRAQARALADDLASEPLDGIYASDLARASDTARIVAESHAVAVVLLPALRERHFGSWEGLTDSEILSRFPDARPGHWGDGETPEEMTGRVLAALHAIAGSHPGGTVLAVSHGGPLRAVLLHCGAERDGPIGNCDVVRVTVGDGRIGYEG
jgi:probable phosphoglycerate mutase